MDFLALRQELIDEYYFWAERPSDTFYRFQPSYWSARGTAWAASVSNQPGMKYLLTASTPAGLTDSVRRALMFCDHVIIRHDVFVPHQARAFVGRECAFPGSRDLTWRPADNSRIATLPHIPGCAESETAHAFLEWTRGEGQEWVRQGLATYLPCVVPRRAAVSLTKQGVNVAAACRELNVLPDDARFVSERSATAIARLRIPYLSAVTPDALRALRNDEADALARFQQHMMKLLDALPGDADSEEYSRRLHVLAQDIGIATRDLEARVRLQATSARWHRIGVEVMALSAVLIYMAGASGVAAITAGGAAAVAAAKLMADQVAARHALRENPWFALTRLGAVDPAPVAGWQPQISMRPHPTPDLGAPDDQPMQDGLSPGVAPEDAPGWGHVLAPDDTPVWLLCSPRYPPALTR